MERRTLPGETPSDVMKEIEDLLDRLRRDDPSFSASAHAMFSRPAYELEQVHALPRTLAAVARKRGLAPRMSGASFWTDAAVLAHAGIPSVLFGPGGAGLHSTEEYVIVSDVLRCRDVLASLASEIAETTANR
jgi:acetylornithine deacetylase